MAAWFFFIYLFLQRATVEEKYEKTCAVTVITSNWEKPKRLFQNLVARSDCL